MLNPSSVDVTVYKGMEVAVATRVEENHLAAIHSEEEREQLFILLLNYVDVFAGRDGELDVYPYNCHRGYSG